MDRLFGEKLRIRQVLGVGGKQQVIARFRLREKAGKLSNEFYMVDGDFDELLARSIPKHRRFHRLSRYDIESYLIEEFAIYTLAEENNPRLRIPEYKKLIRFHAWYGEVVDAVCRLVACAVIMQLLAPTESDTAPSIERFVTGKKVLPEPDLIEAHITKMRSLQSQITDGEFEKRLSRMLNKMGRSRTKRLRWISGKKIFLLLLIRVLKNGTR
jgi:hypothetical protein